MIANNEVWERFIKTSKQDKNTDMRMVRFYTESTDDPYYIDLFFNEGYYYLFDSSSISQEKQPFLYLLSLEGGFGNPKKDSGVVVLTDDNTLTLDVIMKSMLSSNMEYTKSVSPYRLVMFQ